MHVAYRRYISVDGKFVVDVEGRVSFVFSSLGLPWVCASLPVPFGWMFGHFGKGCLELKYIC